MKTSVSKPFIEFCLKKYPALVNSKELRALFAWLCFATFLDGDSGRLVVARSKLAAHVSPQLEERAFHVGDLLREMQEKVLPELRWTGYSAAEGKAREILSDGFDAEMIAALDAELRLPFEKDFVGKVNFVTGRFCDKSSPSPALEEHRKSIQRADLNPTQLMILDYLSQVDGRRRFLPRLTRNKDGIETEIAKLSADVQRIQRRILNTVMEQPQMLYRPGKRTCRLNPYGEGVLGLKGEVRRAFCTGWSECDLRSSQFTILATVLDAPISKALIQSGTSLWRSLYLFTHAEDRDPPKDIKEIFKEGLYSVAFGKLVSNLARFLRPHGLERLLDHPVMRELLQLRDGWFARIEAAGGAPDVWGTWHSIRAQKDCAPGEEARLPRHVAATVIQSWEMEIIAPIFSVAKRYGATYQFGIVLFQHDGATISFHAHDVRKERAKKLLRDAVETRAKKLGVHTTLEFADLGTASPRGADRGENVSLDDFIIGLEAELRAGGYVTDRVREPCHLCGNGDAEFFAGEVIAAWCCDACWAIAEEAEASIAAERECETATPMMRPPRLLAHDQVGASP